MKKFALYITGQKGLAVLHGLKHRPEYVVTYCDKKTSSNDDQQIVMLCKQRRIPLYDKDDRIEGDEVKFFIGWQYLVKDNLEQCIVLHDAYLPEMKGFAPTPTALILGHDLGATAFQPTMKIDTGPVYIRHRISVKHPMRLQDANNLVAKFYVSMIKDILEKEPKPTPMEDFPEKETFSIWRDEEDMVIDWSKSAEEIQRMVYALSYPLKGAKAKYRNETISIYDAMVETDMEFVDRHPGKIWSIDNGRPLVICGRGMLRLGRVYNAGGREVPFTRMRERLG